MSREPQGVDREPLIDSGARRILGDFVSKFRIVALPAVVAAVTVLMTALPAQSPANAAIIPWWHQTACKLLQRFVVHGANGRTYFVRNDNFKDTDECVRNYGRHANFTVVSSAADTSGPETQAYPMIGYGCAYGRCTAGSVLPRRVSRLYYPELTWFTRQHAGGRWNAGFDIWFNRNRSYSGQADGTELMLWLGTRDFPVPAGSPVYRLGGADWYEIHWRTASHVNPKIRWTLVIFRRVHPTRHVWRLRLKPFVNHLLYQRLLHRSWYLESIDGGFEIWRGGAGLATTSFAVRGIDKPSRRHK